MTETRKITLSWDQIASAALTKIGITDAHVKLYAQEAYAETELRLYVGIPSGAEYRFGQHEILSWFVETMGEHYVGKKYDKPWWHLKRKPTHFMFSYVPYSPPPDNLAPITDDCDLV